MAVFCEFLRVIHYIYTRKPFCILISSSLDVFPFAVPFRYPCFHLIL